MKFGWAVFGLVVIIAAAAYAFRWGVYVGYAITEDPDPAPCAPYWYLSCRYLHPSGFSSWASHSGSTREEAAKGSCPFFHAN